MTEQPGTPPPSSPITPGDPLAGRPPEPATGPPPPAPVPAAPPPPPAAQPPVPPGHVPATAPAVGPAAGELAIKRSVVRCAVASVLSFGVYAYWWFYQYRKRLNAELGKNDDAALHTVGLLVPFLNLYLIYLLWNDISDARARVGLSEIPALGYIIGAIFLAPVFYGIVNANLNEYWDRRTGGRAIDAPWTTGEKVATFVPMVVFGTFWVLVIAFVAGTVSS